MRECARVLEGRRFSGRRPWAGAVIRDVGAPRGRGRAQYLQSVRTHDHDHGHGHAHATADSDAKWLSIALALIVSFMAVEIVELQ